MDIIPSFLMGPGDTFAGDSSYANNILLRLGEVQEVIPPTSPKSRSRKVNEYRVFVQVVENGTAITTMYENCVLSNLFGGFADQLRYSLRAEKNADTKDSQRQPGQPGKGAKVLLLCLNGETHSPMIIGGLRDSEMDAKDDEKKGHNLFFSFNGVEIEIDKDGALALTVKGATTADNKPAEGVATDALPSKVSVGKDGKITASTKDGKNQVVIEQTGKITVTAESEIEINCKTAKVNASSKATVVSKMIELGASGIGGVPAQGVVLGSHIDSLTGAQLFVLGGVSTTTFSKL